MQMTLLVHILAGGVGLISGLIALYAAKGAMLHRKAGIVFVYAMLVTCVGGLVIAAVRGVAPAINIPAALLTSSLVITSLTTVHPPSTAARWLDLAPMLVALAVGLTKDIVRVEGAMAREEAA